MPTLFQQKKAGTGCIWRAASLRTDLSFDQAKLQLQGRTVERVGVKLTAPIKASFQYQRTFGKASLFNHLADFSSRTFPEFLPSLIPKPYSPNDHKTPQTSKANKRKTLPKTHHQGNLFFIFPRKTLDILVKAAKRNTSAFR